MVDAALTPAGDGKVFATHLHSAGAREIAELRLGKRTEQLYENAEKLQRQLDRYAYGPPQIRFTDADVDQARAAGVLIEFDGPAWPIIVDRPLYRELVKGAIRRTHDDLEAKAAAAVKEKTTARAGKQPADPLTVAKRERDAELRELTDQAHGVNLDFGHALIHNLTSVDPTDIDVARFFVLCVHPHRTSYADCVAMPMRAPCARREGSRSRYGRSRPRRACGEEEVPDQSGGSREHRSRLNGVVPPLRLGFERIKQFTLPNPRGPDAPGGARARPPARCSG